MKLMIDIDLYGTAYHALVGNTSVLGDEVARILRRLADHVEGFPIEAFNELHADLSTTNGKRVGTVTVD